jgi:hypothetical protein
MAPGKGKQMQMYTYMLLKLTCLINLQISNLSCCKAVQTCSILAKPLQKHVHLVLAALVARHTSISISSGANFSMEDYF